MCWETDKPPKPSEPEDDPVPDDTTTEPGDTTTDHGDTTVDCAMQHFGPDEIDEEIIETITDATEGNEAWNDTFTWDAKFTLDISRQDCAITATVRIRVEGDITETQLNDWEAAIESKWNNKVFMECPDDSCPEACLVYSVWVDVQFVEAGEHYVVTAQTADATSDGIAGLNGTTGMTGWGVEDVIDVTHEFGHMLGNTEEYYTVNGVAWGPERVPDGYVMNNPANNPHTRNYYLIEEKVAALMGSGVTCTTLFI